MTASLATIETPAGVLEWDRVRENARRVVDYCAGNRLRWRPHIKTHKSLEVARLQLAAGASGLTVATPHEAEVMATVCDDLLLAYPPVGATKVGRVLSLPRSIALTVALDSEEALRPLAAEAARRDREVGVLIEADVGMRRVGLGSGEAVAALARTARDLPGVAYRGLMFYPGHIRVDVSRQDEGMAALSVRVGALLDALRAADLAPEVVSGGSTPTLWRSHEVGGLTEVRSGTCIYNDRDIHALGACDESGLAYTVLATVVSTAVPDQAVIDAGSKALAKEPYRGEGKGFGVLLTRPSVRVKALSEEHGILDLAESDWRPRVGDRVRVVPNHVCVSVNLQDRLWAMTDGQFRRVELEGRGR